MNKIILISFLLLISVTAFSQNGRSQKRGIAYGHHSEADMSVISGGLSWWYNWYHQPEAGVAGVYQKYNMDFVPMTWNNSFNETALRAFYASHPEAKYLLAFNEPNFIAQANMKPSQVAAAWPRLEAIAADYNLKIVGPAVNWCGECVTEGGVKFTNPYAYLDTFFSVCPHCRVDYIAVHNYMCYTSALSSYIQGFKKYGKKIWLTEYACWDQNNITPAMQKNLMKGSIDYLENDTMIFRYSWFTGNRSGAYPYLDIYAPQPGKLTELGQFYVTYKASVHDTSYYFHVPLRIEAENYSSMSGISTEAVTDFDGADDVGWIDAGDWLTYNIDVPSAGVYYIYFRVAATTNTSIILKVDGQNADTLKVASTGGWQNWKTAGIQTDLPAGKHKLTVFAPAGGFNLNWLRISDHANTPPVIDAGADQIITLPVNTAHLSAAGTDTDKDSLRVQWKKISGPATFSIISMTSFSTDVTGLAQGKYTFEAVVSDGTEIISDRVVVEVVTATGWEEPGLETFSVYPNPVNKTFYFQSGRFSGKNEFTLTDPLGKIRKLNALTRGNNLYELDASAFQPGYYILKVIRESGTILHPIIKF